MKRRLHANVLNRLGDKEKDDNYSIATLLDPRFKNCFFREKRSQEQAEAKLLELVRDKV